MKAIIVDDEPQSHEALINILSRYYPDVNVVASAYSVKEGYEKMLEFNPDFLFLDIELPDGLGFDLLQKFDEPDFMVIFITAHAHYALEAIDFGAIDYMLKPFDQATLGKALEKVRKRLEDKLALEQMKFLLQILKEQQQTKHSTRMSVSNMDGVYFFEIKDIIRLEAQKNYTMFRIAEASKDYFASKNIGNYLTHFQAYPDFRQTHRSHLVNRNFVVKFVLSESYLLMKNGDQVPVSRGFRDGIMDWLNGD